MDPDAAFMQLQSTLLAGAWAADRRGSGEPHTIVALPSFSLDSSVYEHYGDRIPPLENRFLHCVLLAARPEVDLVYLSSLPVPPAVLDGYLALVPPEVREDARRSIHLVPAGDASARPLAAKLLTRPELLAGVRALCRARGSAMIEAWNVAEPERDLALALGIPVFGTPPALRSLATKSNGRRLMRAAGVPLPRGVEDVRDLSDVVEAVDRLRQTGATRAGVIVKLDDSVAGDGNVVLPPELLRGDGRVLRSAIEPLFPDWYVNSLESGGVVEERIAGSSFRSPSCQADITPLGQVEVLATHEQRLGGPDQQVYLGCSCPADPAYGPLLARLTTATGQALAERGAGGRFGVDFVVCRKDSGWAVHGVEINLRKGGTTHTFGLTRLLTGCAYDAAEGTLRAPDGRRVQYAATDNLVDEAWRSLTPADVHRALADAGLGYDSERRVGVVPHLLDCLPVDGRMGYTAIAGSAATVADLERRVEPALGGARSVG